MGVKIRAGLVAVALLTVAACATRYGDMGLTGGVAAEPITSDIYRIKARGNGYTDQARVQDFVPGVETEPIRVASADPPSTKWVAPAARAVSADLSNTYQATRVGNTVIGSYNPGVTVDFVKPGQDTYVRVVTVARGQQPPPGAFDAAEIARTIGPRLKGA
jgi:hypothetical protein